MTYFLLETIVAPLASLAALLGLQARSAASPLQEATLRPASVAARPADAAPVSAAAAAAEAKIYPDYDYGYNSGCMASVMAAIRTF